MKLPWKRLNAVRADRICFDNKAKPDDEWDITIRFRVPPKKAKKLYDRLSARVNKNNEESK